MRGHGYQNQCDENRKLDSLSRPSWHEAVGELTSQNVAHNHTSSCKHEHQSHHLFGNTSQCGQRRGDVAVPAEDTAIAHDGADKEQPGCKALQKSELTSQSVVGKGCHLGYPARNG